MALWGMSEHAILPAEARCCQGIRGGGWPTRAADERDLLAPVAAFAIRCSPMPSDVVAIIGAGPAGAFAAEMLARAGRKVLLIDEKLAWEKPCGGGITHKALV